MHKTLAWQPCACGQRHWERSARSWWMRLFFPSRRLFRCHTCGQFMLVAPPLELRRLP